MTLLSKLKCGEALQGQRFSLTNWSCSDTFKHPQLWACSHSWFSLQINWSADIVYLI